MLNELHPHPRDAHIEFEPVAHLYTVHGEGGYTSVTTWNHTHFEHFDEARVIQGILRNPRWRKDPEYKYFGMTAEAISRDWEDNRARASALGTAMHNDIENFFNGLEVHNDSVEFAYFHNFWADFQRQFPRVRPYRTEWCVYYEAIRIAGSIDMIFEDTDDGSLWIYDWKRAKEILYEPLYRATFARTPCLAHLPDTNFWHYSLQLNVYKLILEQQYDKRVTKMCLVCLHPDNHSKNYELFEVLPLDAEMPALLALRRAQLLDAAVAVDHA